MRSKMEFLFLALFILLTVSETAQAAGRLQKRLNFNFLRTWQPALNAEPIRIYGDVETNEIEPTAIVRTPEQRIKSRLLCMSALASPAACNNL